MLNRLGNKSKLSNLIISYFPKHDMFIDMFFGAGGIFFNKEKSKYNICNDKDSDVFNLFMVLKNKPDELLELIKLTPIHYDLLRYWLKNKEIDELYKAMRFLFLSNYTLYGTMEVLKYGYNNPRKSLILNFEKTLNFITDVQFTNCDFRNLLDKIEFRHIRDYNRTFIYADPPYINTRNNYEHSFTKEDSMDLFDVLCNSGFKFAMSEFNNEFILEQAKKRNLQIHYIKNRVNLKNRGNEILIINYDYIQKSLYDDL